MHAQALQPSRRSFLKLGAIGLAAVVGGGYIAARITDGSADPLLPQAANLSAEVQQMLYRVFDGVLHGMLPQGREQELLTKTVGALDYGISGLPPHIQKELTGLLSLLAFAPVRFALIGRWSGWPNATREDVTALMNDLKGSDKDLQRLIYITLHDLATSSFYGLEESWELVGYPGPLVTGPGEEV